MPRKHTLETLSERIQLFGNGTGVKKNRKYVPSISVMERKSKIQSPVALRMIAQARQEIAINKARREGNKILTDKNGRQYYQPRDKAGKVGRMIYLS